MAERQGPLIYYQRAGGNSRPEASPVKTEGWEKFFEAQSLAEDVVIKTSEISPTGLMVVATAGKVEKQFKNIADLSPQRAQEHLSLVKKVMCELQEIRPQAQVYLWHINATQSVPFKMPSDFGKDRRELHLGIPKKNSQTVGTVHSHVDALGDQFIEIHSLPELAEEHARGHEGEDGKAFANERRRLIRPRVFHRFVAEIWKSELESELLTRFPDLFEEVDRENFDHLPPLPTASLALKDGFESFDQPEFAQAVQFVHQQVARRWKEIATFLQEIAKLHQLGDQTGVHRSIEDFTQKQHWAVQFKERFLSLAKVIQPDRRKVRDKDNWLHRQFNFTQGAVQWNGQKTVFFINPTPDINAGVESIGVHSVRVPHEFSNAEVKERIEFRAAMTERLYNKHGLAIGPEGHYTLGEYALRRLAEERR